jgi:hypothetical protein
MVRVDPPPPPPGLVLLLVLLLHAVKATTKPTTMLDR